MKRKLLITLFTILLAFCSLGLFACGGGDDSGDNGGEKPPIVNPDGDNKPSTSSATLTYELVDNAYTVKGVNILTNGDYEVVIPETFNDLPVTVIGDRVFDGQTRLTGITIGSNITTIGEYAFRGCTLTSITIPDKVTNIGKGAFDNCHNLTNIIIPDSVTSVGSYAFSYCTGLTSITIGKGVVNLGEYAFRGCSNLTEIKYNATEHNELTASKKFLYDAGKNVDGITLTIGANVKKIPAYMFDYSTTNSPKITSVIFEENGICESIGERAFSGCDSLSSVTIPDNVKSIANKAFYRCEGLKSVEIGESVTTVDENAFSDCPIEVAKVPVVAINSIPKDNLTTIIVIGDGAIGEEALKNCDSLTSVTIDNGIIHIAREAFSGCQNLTEVNYMGTIDQWVMISFGCENANPLYYADSLLINDEEITEVKLTTATTIGEFVFYNYNLLTSIVVPISVTNILDNAFNNCGELKTVYYSGSESDKTLINVGNDNDDLLDATWYYFSENEPTENGNYWHYVDGVPTAW